VFCKLGLGLVLGLRLILGQGPSMVPGGPWF